MDYIITKSDGSEALYHHGIKGQRWGIRKYQNEDGSYTEAGRIRYFNDRTEGLNKKVERYGEKIKKKGEKGYFTDSERKKINQKLDKYSSKVLKKTNKLNKQWAKKVNRSVTNQLLKESKNEIKQRSKKYKELKKEAKKDPNIKKTEEYKKIRKQHGQDIFNKVFYDPKTNAVLNIASNDASMKKYRKRAKELGGVINI